MQLTNRHRPALLVVAACLGLWLVGTGSTSALTIALEFSDTSPFASNATAQGTIQKAANDISAAITSALRPINQPTFFNTRPDVQKQQYRWDRDSASINNQTLITTYGWNFQYTAAGGGVDIPAELLAANRIKLFVRGESFGGGTLGKGGSAGIGFAADYNISFSGSISQPALQNQFTEVVDYHEAAAQSEFVRGAGPVMSTIAGTSSINFGNGNTASAPYSVSYGPAYGTLALDTSWGGKTFEQYWHINHATPVAAGKNDLYSVALHEMLHAIGYGSSETWAGLLSGNNWTGSNVIAEYGSGTNMVVLGPGSDSPYPDHVAYGRTGRNIYTGSMQEAVMDPNLTVGTRKYLTTLDLAFLRDLNYSTILPDFGLDGDFNGDDLVNLADYAVWRDNRGGLYNNADYITWKNNFGMTAASFSGIAGSTAIPEPGSLQYSVLASLLFSVIVSRFRAGPARTS